MSFKKGAAAVGNAIGAVFGVIFVLVGWLVGIGFMGFMALLLLGGIR